MSRNATAEQSQRITTLERTWNLSFRCETGLKRPQARAILEARINARIDDLIKWYVPTSRY